MTVKVTSNKLFKEQILSSRYLKQYQGLDEVDESANNDQLRRKIINREQWRLNGILKAKREFI